MKCILFLHNFFIDRKNRFYLYSRRLPSDLQDVDRDIFNEKPSKEDIIAVPESQGIYSRLSYTNCNFITNPLYVFLHAYTEKMKVLLVLFILFIYFLIITHFSLIFSYPTNLRERSSSHYQG